MIHHPVLQMLAGSSVFPSCPSFVRPSTDCRRSVAAEKGSTRSAGKLSIHSALPDYKRSCGLAAAFATSAALTWCSASRGGGSRIIPSLSSLRSVASLSCKANRSDAILLGSLFVPRFPNGVDGKLCSRKSFLTLNHCGPQVCSSRLNLVGPSAAGFWGHKSAGQVDEAERLTLRSSRLGSSARRVVTCSSTAGASAAPSSQGPPNFLSTFLANFFAVFSSIGSRLQSIRIGWLDLLTMLRIVLLTAGVFGAYLVSKRAWVMIQAKASGKGEEEQGGGGPMQVLARGATCLQSNTGPWSMTDMAIGLTAIAKLTEKKPPEPPGKEVKDLSKDSNFLLKAQHWRALSEAVYATDSATFSLFSTLPESSLVASSWEPTTDTFRPAYAVFVDAPYGAVVLAVRGTSHVIDMLLNAGTSPEPFGGEGNYAHGGFAHASNVLYEEVLPHIEKAFKDHSGKQQDLKLVVVGHSLGAAVGALTALMLREKFPDLQCWGFCPPACMSLDLARECKSFTTSFIAGHDLVPRFSLTSVEKLRTRIQEIDWDEVESVAAGDEDWKNMKKGIEAFRSLQKVEKETIDKLPGGGEGEESETMKKVKELGRKALDTETGGVVDEMASSFGFQAKDLLGGNESPKGEQDSASEDGEGEDSSPPPLHPPGRLLVMACVPPGSGKMPEQRKDVASERGYGTYPTFDEAKNITWHLSEAEQEDLVEIVVSPWCVSDHMLGNLAEAIGYFQSNCPPAVK